MPDHIVNATFIIAIVLTLSFSMAMSARADISSERQAELLYFLKHDCGSCHGLTRKGGLGSPLLPEAMESRTNEDLAEVILDGMPGTPMPAWRALFSEEEALWMAHAIKTNIWRK